MVKKKEVSMMQVGLNNYQIGNSNVMEKADTKKAEKKSRGQIRQRISV